jgi:hypothetical protein
LIWLPSDLLVSNLNTVHGFDRVVCAVADSYVYCCHGPCLLCRELERQQRAADKGFVHNSSAAAKRKRARVFAAWLVQQYGKERLSAGSGVLDVAGRG